MTFADFIAAYDTHIKIIVGAIASLVVAFSTQLGLYLRDRRRAAKERLQQDQRAQDQQLQLNAQQIQAQAEKEALYLQLVRAQIERVGLLEGRLETERERTNELEKSFQESATRENQLTDALAAIRATNEEQFRQIGGLHSEVNSLKAQLEQRDKELLEERRLREKAEYARSQVVDQWNKEKVDLMKEVETLKKQVKHLESELKTVRSDVAKRDTGELPQASGQ